MNHSMVLKSTAFMCIYGYLMVIIDIRVTQFGLDGIISTYKQYDQI